MPPDRALKRGPQFLVGYVGVMGRQEGIDLLLHAVSHIVHDLGRSDIHFGLVGGGTSLEEMKALASELGVADYVTFTGRVTTPSCSPCCNTADVCVNPDVANEMNDISTMNKIMEYMALGKPIVQFDLDRGPLLRARRVALRQGATIRSISPRRSSSCIDDPERRLRWASSAAARGRRARLAPRGAEAARRLRQARRTAPPSLEIPWPQCTGCSPAGGEWQQQPRAISIRPCGSVCSDLAMWEPFAQPVSPTAGIPSSASTRQKPRSI